MENQSITIPLHIGSVITPISDVFHYYRYFDISVEDAIDRAIEYYFKHNKDKDKDEVDVIMVAVLDVLSNALDDHGYRLDQLQRHVRSRHKDFIFMVVTPDIGV